MNCPQCQTAIPDGSAFCNKCGAPLATGAPSPASPAPGPSLPQPPGMLPPDEPEQDLWKGGFSGKALTPLVLLAFLWLFAIAYVYFKWLKDKGAFWNYACGIVALLPFVYLSGLYLYNKISIRYRLTTHRFFKTVGIIARRMDETELMRVDDVSVSQNVIQRIFNVGTVTIIASDVTDPRLDIEGIDNPIAVKEMIRNNVQKRSRRALNLRQV